MSTSYSRARAIATPALLGLIVLAGACVAPAASAPYYGIYFTAPTVGYIGKTYTPSATATSKLPVTITLDATSTGCSLTSGVVSFDSLGTCVLDANQAGDATHAASKQVQRKITVANCPPLRAGVWTAVVLGKSFAGPITVDGVNFSGTVNLSSLGVAGLGNVAFSGYVDCNVAHMTFNGVALTGVLSSDGSTLSSTYSGISVVLHAPAV